MTPSMCIMTTPGGIMSIQRGRIGSVLILFRGKPPVTSNICRMIISTVLLTGTVFVLWRMLTASLARSALGSPCGRAGSPQGETFPGNHFRLLSKFAAGQPSPSALKGCHLKVNCPPPWGAPIGRGKGGWHLSLVNFLPGMVSRFFIIKYSFPHPKSVWTSFHIPCIIM